MNGTLRVRWCCESATRDTYLPATVDLVSGLTKHWMAQPVPRLV